MTWAGTPILAARSQRRRRRSTAGGTGTRTTIALSDGSDDMADRVRCGHAARPDRHVPDTIRRLGKVHHVALIVSSIDASLGLWRDALGLELETVMDIPYDRVRIAFLGVGESKIELVEPTDDTTGVARFLANKGEGFHHVCFEVPNLAEALLHLEIDGIELIDTAPREGSRGPGRLPPPSVVPRGAWSS